MQCVYVMCDALNAQVWDVARRYALMETMTGHKSTVLAVAFEARTQRLATAG